MVHAELLGRAADDGLRDVRYIRTARSRNSSGYFLGAGIVRSPLTISI
jgi:hypothetical protein